MQGFAWDSYSESSWSMLESQAHEISEFFDLIWVPNSAYAGSMTMNMGYHPVYWFKQDCAFGTETELRSMINTYKELGVGFVADIVINHRNGVGVGGSWVDFPAETYKGKTDFLTSAATTSVPTRDISLRVHATPVRDGMAHATSTIRVPTYKRMSTLISTSSETISAMRDSVMTLSRDIRRNIPASIMPR